MSEHAPLSPLSVSQLEMLEEAVARYEQDVSVPVARHVLDRGITEETATMFRLGAVVNPEPGHDRYRGMMAIPYLDRHGSPLTIRFRCIEDHSHRDFYHGKYNSIPEDPSRVFNVGAIFQAEDEIHVTEGEIDAIILNQLGLPAVAIPGAQGFQAHHRRMLAGFSRVWVYGDPDEAGADFTNRVVRMMKQAKGVRMRDGDVNETYLAGGASAIYELTEAA